MRTYVYCVFIWYVHSYSSYKATYSNIMHAVILIFADAKQIT